MSELSEKLVRVATEAARPFLGERIFGLPSAPSFALRPAVAAVLRQLAEEFETIGEGDCHPADTLRRLAEEAA